jgi:hypothetical protein
MMNLSDSETSESSELVNLTRNAEYSGRYGVASSSPMIVLPDSPPPAEYHRD